MTEAWVILDFEGVGDIDTTAVDMLCDLYQSSRPVSRSPPSRERTNRHVGASRRTAAASDAQLVSFATIDAASVRSEHVQ